MCLVLLTMACSAAVASWAAEDGLCNTAAEGVERKQKLFTFLLELCFCSTKVKAVYSHTHLGELCIISQCKDVSYWEILESN